MDVHQERMEAAIDSIWSELEEIIRYQVEDVLSCVDQKMQGLCKELTQKIDETHVDLQANRTSVNTRTKSLSETISETMGGPS
jgi:uncharacterized membrane-anchored protein YjiN (DUF445 family)